MSTTKVFPSKRGISGEPGVGRILLIDKNPGPDEGLDERLAKLHCAVDYASGGADALRRLRRTAYDVVITDSSTSVHEDLVLVPKIKAIRPATKVIVLAPSTTPDEVIAALRAQVYLCKTGPFDADEIAQFACQAAAARGSHPGIEILSANRDWVSVRLNCQLSTAERLLIFLNELQSELPPSPREDLMTAFREILMNAIEHGGGFKPDQVVDVAAIRTARSIVFYVRDPGAGFRREAIPHAAVSNEPADPARHAEVREELGIRPGGFGILVARGIVDELIYNEVGNEVVLIKYLR